MTTEAAHVVHSVAITGAGSGLGREIAIGFADKGTIHVCVRIRAD